MQSYLTILAVMIIGDILKIRTYTATVQKMRGRPPSQTTQNMRGRPRGIPVSEETKAKRLDSFNETIAKRRQTFRHPPLTHEDVIAKIKTTPGIKAQTISDGRNVNKKLIAQMSKNGDIIRKVPRTGKGYELYLPEMRKEV